MKSKSKEEKAEERKEEAEKKKLLSQPFSSYKNVPDGKDDDKVNKTFNAFVEAFGEAMEDMDLTPSTENYFSLMAEEFEAERE